MNICKKNIPIRIGINSGSINKKYEKSVDNMMESAKDHLRILEALDFHNIVLSIKASSVNLLNCS